ncbi:N-acetyltransferase [Paenibacillus baekrokdamisoli]|uniref:N-acetyltransferase n=1 Tax=Paenibacillus baekrokdamisoli TaxID=1712516 RepID=A0A3G9J7L3_9BACL|nr:GNAT family N-acetyltransferase [Paenibacillus baekrokdamisoli]MBB3073179.1 ribosomal protein S18 acetylase RimI-like enzyme [Paenibacillus baekrokdamisoli]BBH24315.1 N-acetyltransferase [Paenibacillus baekrokdamisoli]
MLIRLLESLDAEIYREIRLDSLKESPESFLTTYEIERTKPIEQTQQNLKVTDSRFTLGAFINNDLIGIVTFVQESNVKSNHKGNVYAMYVSPNYRGQGIGKALMIELVKRAKEFSGLEQINLTVISVNTMAKSLYESIGFKVYGTERNALKSGELYWDEDLMTIRL